MIVKLVILIDALAHPLQFPKVIHSFPVKIQKLKFQNAWNLSGKFFFYLKWMYQQCHDIFFWFLKIRSHSVTAGLWREQLNLVTSWMDSSHVYGSFKCQADNLRNLTYGGQLKSLSHPLGSSFKSLLPRHATNHECRSPSKLCFNAGDDR